MNHRTVATMKTLKDRVALVTGASRKRGIGAEVARKLATQGAAVFITYYCSYDQEIGFSGNDIESMQLLSELRQKGCQVDGLEMDLSTPKAPSQLFDYVEASLGPVHILVNNAAYSMEDGIDNLTATGLDRHYAVNIRAMALLCAEFVRRFKKQRSSHDYGRIINLSSGQSLGPMPGELAYAATKGAVEAFTRSLSPEVGPLGITVNAVDPGITDTGWIPTDLKDKWTQESPMGRVGAPQDVAQLIHFLATKDSGWITGQVLHSRGGL